MKKFTFRKDIQGLRAIAVISVWLFHLNQNLLPGGFIGVDIFFVISGFLVSSIILTQKENQKFSFLKFYESRIKRIVPAYYIFLIIITIATVCVYMPADILYNYRLKLFHSILFNSNNHFATLDNYFGASSTENPLLHTWTLAVEMQFYLFLPLLLFFLNRKKALWVSIIFGACLLFYTQYNFAIGNQNLMYFSLLARMPEFLLGVILSLLQLDNKLSNIKQSLLGILGLILIVFSAVFYNSETVFPGLYAIAPCFGAILILSNNKGILNTYLSKRVPVYIGELSYSIYLWHWGILALIRYYYVEYELTTSQYFYSIVLTLALSYLSYRYIENGFRKMNIRKFCFRFSPIIICLMIVLLSMVRISNYFYKDVYPIHLTSAAPIGLETHQHYIKDIVQGDSLSSDTLLLLGHSHALVTKPFLNNIGKKNHFAFRSITNNTYSTIPGYELSYFKNKADYDIYINLTDIVCKKIKASPIIILATTFERGVADDHLKAFETLKDLLREDQYVILLADFPTLDKNPIRVNRGILKSESKKRDYTLNYDKPPKEIIEYINSHSNFRYLDISKSKAFDNAPYYKDTIMYYDDGHLNELGSLAYADHSGDCLGEVITGILKEREKNIQELQTTQNVFNH